jgi:hypothetical protein
MNSHRSILIITIIGMLLIPAMMAAENKVPRDGTVYTGEADLDVSDCAVRNGDEIAWWDSGNPQGTPTARARVDDVRKFTVDPDTFKGHTGTWFGLVSKKPVFTVEEPFLQVELVENGIDREPSVIKRGSLVSFKIATSLAGLSKRAGSSGALVSLNLTGPNDTVFHTLSSAQGSDFNLDSVYVWSTPYDTGVVWDTKDKKKFPDGEYTLSASTNVNRIDEIYHESGITYTEKQTYTISDKETKATPTETEKPSSKSKTAKGELSAEGTVTPTETDEKSSTKSSKKKVTDEPTDEPTDKPTAEPTSSSKSSKKKVTDEPTDEPTDKPTVEPTSSSKSSKQKVTEEPTEVPTDVPTDTVTETPTDTPTDMVTETPTEEPTGRITASPTHNLPHPPRAAASPTPAKGSPLNPGVMLAALGLGAVVAISRRR